MNVRWEVTERQWLESFAGRPELPVDYVLLDLADRSARPWLDEARARVEIIGRAHVVPHPEALDAALDLDVDFLCLSSAGENFEARRLPLRLIYEDSSVEVGSTPELFGAAWARRLTAWEALDRETLAEVARRERIILAPAGDLPSPEWVAAVAPFAAGVPDGASVEDLAVFGAR
jgi:hypothetical protein